MQKETNRLIKDMFNGLCWALRIHSLKKFFTNDGSDKLSHACLSIAEEIVAHEVNECLDEDYKNECLKEQIQKEKDNKNG